MAKDLKSILDSLKKQGMNTLIVGDNQPEVPRLPSGSIGLDRILGGGYPMGRMTELYGDPSSGKSLMAYLAIKEVQKNGGVAALIDAENSFTRDWALNLGIDPNQLLVSGTVDGSPRSGESFLEDVIKFIEAEVDLVVVDSISALTPQSQIDKGLEEGSAIAEQARMLSLGLRKVNAALGAKNKTALIWINQVRSNPGVMFGNPNQSTGGKALTFYDAIKVYVYKRTGAEFTYYKDPKNKDEGLAGQRVKVTTEKNKLYRPKMSCEFDVYFDIGPENLSVGVDTASELLTECLKANIIQHPNNVIYEYNGQKYKGKLEITKVIKEDENLQKELLGALNVSN